MGENLLPTSFWITTQGRVLLASLPMFTHHESPITNAEAIFGQARAVEQRQVLALYAETEKATAQLSINRSALIRSALQQFLDKWRRKELDRELAEGYIANASQARETAEAFSHVDSELL